MSQVGRKVASGSLLLSSGSIVAMLISALGSIIIARLLAPSEYGLISISLIFPLMLAGLTDLGLSSALVRFSAIERGEGYISSGLTFKLIIAFLSGVLIFSLSNYLASILGRPYIAPFLRILSLYTSSSIVLGALTQVLVGLGEYGKVMLITIIQNALRTSISIALIIAGLGLGGAILGFSISYTISSAIAFVLVTRYVGRWSFRVGVLREMLIYSLPLYIPVIIGVPIGQYYNLLLAWFVTNEEIGNYSIASNLLTPLGIIGGSISTALFSGFSSMSEEYKLRDTVRKATLYTTVIVPPLALAISAFSELLTFTIYGSAYRLAPTYLSLLALQGLLAPLGSYAIGPYLNSVGATGKSMKISLFGTFLGVPLTTVLVMRYGILGSIISLLLCSLASSIYALHIAKQDFSISLDIGNGLKMLIPPAIAYASSRLVISMASPSMLHIAIGALTYVLALGLSIPLFVDKRCLIELRELSSGLKLVGKPLSRIIGVELRLAEMLT